MIGQGRVAWVVAGALLVTTPGFAADGQGTSSFHFLNLGTGARTEALSGAATAFTEGVDALAWNPARLARDPARQVSASFFNWLDGVQSGYLGAVQPITGRGALGLAARSLSVSDFDNVPGEASVGQSDFALSLGGGYSVFESLAAGLALKVIRSSVAGEDATGWAVDAGLNYRYVEGWDVAWAVRNTGPAFRYGDGADEQLPTQTAVGISGTIRELRFDSEVLWENGPGWIGALGAEYWIRDRVALRAGSQLGRDGNDGVEPWSAGLGIRARDDLEVDYSVRDGKLDVSHRLGLRWSPNRKLTGPGDALAPSPREFYLNVLSEALDQGLAGLPRQSGDTVLVRGSAVHEANPLISKTIAERLESWGFGVQILEPEPELPPDLDPETARQVAESLGQGLVEGNHPMLEFDIVSSDYLILSRRRARVIGPRSIQRQAEVELAFRLTKPGSEDVQWSSSGHSEDTETVASARVPSSTGYPQAKGTAASAKPMHPLVEPAIVGGIVAGLAVIFFSNRNVGE